MPIDLIIDAVLIQSGAGSLLVGGEMLDREGSRGSGIAGGERHPELPVTCCTSRRKRRTATWCRTAAT